MRSHGTVTALHPSPAGPSSETPPTVEDELPAVELPSGPLWARRHMLLLGLLQAVAFVLLMVGYSMAADELRFERQVGALNVGAAALIVSGLANVAWLTAGRSRINASILALRPAETGAPVVTPEAREWVTVRDAGQRRHRPGCPLVAGKTTVPARDDLPVCGVCGDE